MVLIFCRPAIADTPTTLPKAPEGAFEVYEWVIFVADPSQPQLNTNAATLFNSTLPDFVGGRRNPAPPETEATPTPIGVIRFSGASGSDKVDVQLTNKGGKFLAHWPKGQNRQTGVLWSNFVIGGDAPASQEAVGATHWFNLLRAGASPFILKDGRGERFLVYDLEPNHKLDLKVTAGASPLQYTVSHNGKLALKDLVFYKPSEDGWHTATLGSLQPTNPPKSTTKPSGATKSAADAEPPSSSEQPVAALRIAGVPGARVARVRAAAIAPAAPATEATPEEPTAPAPTSPTTPPATTGPATQPSTHPSTHPSTTQASTRPVGTIVELSTEGQKEAAAVLAPWRDKLAAAGLPPTDLDLILAILQKQALDSKRLTAIYRLDADQLEEIMPLEVTPQPRKTTRAGLVIVRNIDPAIITEIDSLVAQLGDDSWAKREDAFTALQQLGLAAKPKLEATLKNAKDPEVIYRVERLVAALGQDPNAANPGRVGRRR